MKNTLKIVGIIALTAVIGFLMVACDDDKSNNPASKKITWTQDSKNYELVYTELSASKSTYILSVGSDGYSVGYLSISGSAFNFTEDSTVYSSSGNFTMNIDSSANKVTTTSAQTIRLIKSGGSISSTSLPVTDATATITDNTGGGSGTNPFIGNWEDSGVKVSVSKNLTWSASATGYKGSGSYAYISNEAIIYDSDGDFFGYAYISSGKMIALTFNGDYDFVKK